MFDRNVDSTPHKWVEERLSDYMDGRLRREERGRLEHHLATCRSCQTQLDSLRWTVSLLNRAPKPALPRSFVLPVRKPASRPSWGLVALQFATAVATLCLFSLVGIDLILQYGGGALSAPPQAARSDNVAPTQVIALNAQPSATQSVSAKPGGGLTASSPIPPTPRVLESGGAPNNTSSTPNVLPRFSTAVPVPPKSSQPTAVPSPTILPSATALPPATAAPAAVAPAATPAPKLTPPAAPTKTAQRLLAQPSSGPQPLLATPNSTELSGKAGARTPEALVGRSPEESQSALEATSTAEAPPRPSPTLELPTPTATLRPSPTPEPPTATPRPTRTPVPPTPTPRPSRTSEPTQVTAPQSPTLEPPAAASSVYRGIVPSVSGPTVTPAAQARVAPTQAPVVSPSTQSPSRLEPYVRVGELGFLFLAVFFGSLILLVRFKP